MHSRSIFVLLVGAMLLGTACGGSTGEIGTGDGGPVGPSGAQTGTFTLSGAVTGTAPCLRAVASWNASANLTGINLGGASDELGVLIGFAVSHDGAPAVKTYALGDPGVRGEVTVGKGTTMWSTDFANSGTYTVTVTSLGEPKPDPLGNSEYPIHGTAHASIPPGGTASGMLDLDATF